MNPIRFITKFFSAFVIFSIGAFWSFVVVFNLLFTACKKGFGKVFSYKDRSKDAPPLHYKAWDEETRKSPGPSTKRWNHAYVTVPESGMRFHYVHTGKVPSNIAISDIDGETVKLGEDYDSSTEGNGKPKLMLLIHGFPECWFSWRHVLRYFDKQHDDIGEYFVVAPDLRGYGDSDKPKDGISYHLKLLTSDIRGIVAVLGYKKFVLVGHDWGGAISYSVAATYPEILDKCIILNCAYKFAFADAFWQKPSQLLKSWYMFYFQIPYLPEWTFKLGDYANLRAAFIGKTGGIQNAKNHLTDEELEVFKYGFRHGSSGPINFYRALIWPLHQPGPPLQYPRIKTGQKPLHAVPMLLIWGDKDQFLNDKLATCSEKYFNKTNGSKLVFIEGASHWVQQDAPEEAIKHIVDFLK